MNVGNGVRVNEAILNKLKFTPTFFSLRKTTESLPRMASAVIPQVLTALKAYST